MLSRKYGCDMPSWREERMRNMPMNFWQRVYELQNRKGMLLCEMAHYAGLEDEEFEELQRSGKEPDLLTAVKIAFGLGVSVEYLVTGKSCDAYKDKYDGLVKRMKRLQQEFTEIQIEQEQSDLE